MIKRCFEVSALMTLILFLIVSSVLAFPNFINYQGQLTDSSGNLLTGEYALTFMIYGEETEGEALWTEQHTIIVTNGLYNAELGVINTFPEDLFETEMLYLEVIIHNEDTGNDEILSPRIPFTSTGFSMKAKDAETIAWSNITGKPATFADDVMYVDSNGNVGIGTSTPNATFQIIGSISRQGTTLNGTNTDTHVNLGVNSFTDSNFSTVSGGYNNIASSWGSTVSGGESNTASGHDATVSGGVGNIANNWSSTVSGGGSNTASGWGSTISGGANNVASGTWSAVSGGLLNTASGHFSTVLGGGNNIAAGDYSWAGGHNMQLTEDADRTFAWGYSDSNVSISTPDSFIIYSGNVGIGTKNPAAMLEVDGDVYFEGGDGDVNLDGELNITDPYCVMNYLNRRGTLSREEFAHADVDGDGRVTWEDAAMVFGLYQRKSKDSLKREMHSVYGAINILNSDTFYVNGNAGIGTMNPTEKLEVDGAVKAIAFIGDGSYLTGISSESFARSTSKTVTASYSPEFGDPGLIADGVFAPEGTHWSDPNYAVKLNSAGYDTNLKIDLGAIYDIYRLRVQADCNDDYKVEHSMDDSTWNVLYDLPRVADGGLRTRDSGTFTSVKARYMRIYAVSGDNAYSVSEVEVYAYGINIADSGNVGIGTTNPEKPLEVTGSDERGIAKLSFSTNDRYLSLGGDWPYIDSYGTGARLLLNFNSDQDIDMGNGDLYIVNSSGNVGIGTSNPGAKLTISNSTSYEYGKSSVFVSSPNSYFDFNAGLVFRGTGNLWSARFTSTDGMNPDGEILGIYKEEIGSGILGGPIAVFKNNGNVGIGTTSPIEEFHLAGSDNTPTLLIKPNTMDSGDVSKIRFEDPDRGTAPMEIQYIDDGDPDLAIIGGNVGIGTTSPKAKLHVYGNMKCDNEIRFKNSTDMKGIVWGTSDWLFSHSRIDDYNGQLYIMTDDNFYISSIDSGNGSPGAVRFYINTNTGNVGIGTVSPEVKLDIRNTTSGIDTGVEIDAFGADPFLRFEISGNPIWSIGVDDSDSDKFKIGTSAINTNSRLTIDSSGNVGIGTTSPSYKLQINGTAYATGAAGALSDYRHKTNISDISFDAIEIVKELRPVTFEWKEPQDSGMEGPQLGFVAQEVEEVLPEAVLTQDNEEQTKGLKYNALIPVLVEAVKIQQKQLEEKQAKIEELIARISALEAAVLP